jgi:rfaE bifunctional protein nucleotidyltransferase chain/domain/rfaE bifunctional protein kinase chain/domain
MITRVVVVGDVLLDRDIEGDVNRVSPDAPVPVVEIGSVTERAGGAGLAATMLAGRADVEVRLVTALADDEPAKRLSALLTDRLAVTQIVTAPGTRCKTRIRSAGQSVLRMDTEAPSVITEEPDLAALQAELEDADAVLVSDYAGGITAHPGIRKVLRRWASQRAMIWDPHPRGGSPVPGLTLVTPNTSEARGLCTDPVGAVDELAARLRDQWQAWAVAVTDGARGVFTATDGPPLFTPTPFEHRGDACGAGDRFAATVAARLGAGAVVHDAVQDAVDDTAAWLSSGGVNGVPQDDNHLAGYHGLDAGDLIRRVHAAGGTVVATGGCFDVLHAGHIACLEAARRLGDALVVLVNSDASVQRLKGARRPVNPIEDRRRVLESLSCVDAVAVFGADNPCELLDQLRPDVWVKGGDYAADKLPEASVVQSWGGRVVVVAYLDGRSTSTILERSMR